MANREQKPDIVEQLKQAIRRSGLSLSEIARRSGVDHGRLSRFCRSERTLTMSAAAKVCEILGMTLIYDGAGAAPPVDPQPKVGGQDEKKPSRRKAREKQR
jgi:transcriptional regulator with XRE-family HTH domain